MRYEVISGSRTGHCCFRFTVSDKSIGEYGGSGQLLYHKIMCECFEEADANAICAALNVANGDQFTPAPTSQPLPERLT